MFLLPEAVPVTDYSPMTVCPGHCLADVRGAGREPRVSQPVLHQTKRLVCQFRGGGPGGGPAFRRAWRGLPAPTLVVQTLCQAPVALEACVEALAERNALAKTLPGKPSVGLSDNVVSEFSECALKGVA